MSQAAANPRFAAAVGAPIQTGPWYNASVAISHDRENCHRYPAAARQPALFRCHRAGEWAGSSGCLPWETGMESSGGCSLACGCTGHGRLLENAQAAVCEGWQPAAAPRASGREAVCLSQRRQPMRRPCTFRPAAIYGPKSPTKAEDCVHAQERCVWRQSQQLPRLPHAARRPSRQRPPASHSPVLPPAV